MKLKVRREINKSKKKSLQKDMQKAEEIDSLLMMHMNIYRRLLKKVGKLV